MSSATSVITTLGRPTPNTAIWRIRNTTAGGPNDYVLTRSFVLSALVAQHAEQESTVFSEEMADLVDDEDFHEEHVAKHVSRVVFLGRFNEQEDDEWPDDTDELISTASEDELAKRFHHVVLLVDVTDPKVLEGLPAEFETSAYDVWWDDPHDVPQCTSLELLSQTISSAVANLKQASA